MPLPLQQQWLVGVVIEAGPEDILWYYREVSAIFCEQGPEALATELSLVVEQLHAAVTGAPARVCAGTPG